MISSLSQKAYWDEAAKTKEFKDPLYLHQLKQYITSDSTIVEYGCGYGRIVNLLLQDGFSNVQGFDFSSSMIARGKTHFPNLNLHQIEHATLPLANNSVDCIIMSTVLCCIPDLNSQQTVIEEITRVLKPDGLLYLTDFLITPSEHMTEKYKHGHEQYRVFGIYKTSEGAVVRHYTLDYISYLLNDFHSLWFHEEQFVTMNNNPVNTFHGIYKLKV